MSDRNLKRLKRSELIEIIYQLKKSEEELTARCEELQRQLDDKTLKIENSGSLAEAALAVSGFFDSAQAAADIYLSQLKARLEDEGSDPVSVPTVAEPEPIAVSAPTVAEPEPISVSAPMVAEPEPIAVSAPMVTEPEPIPVSAPQEPEPEDIWELKFRKALEFALYDESTDGSAQ